MKTITKPKSVNKLGNFWILNFAILIMGLLPLKMPDFYKENNKKNILLVSRHECTCCGDFEIEKGELEIPKNYLKYFPHSNEIFEITIAKEEYILNNIGYDFLIDSKFILEVELVGVDSTEGNKLGSGCDIKPILKVNNWSPTEYYPFFDSFDSSVIIIGYLICILSFILLSIINIIVIIKRI